MKPLIVIPARMQATRLPGKPLAMIAGKPMVAQVLLRAKEAGIGPAIVACEAEEIAHAVKQAGGTAILTDPSHPSGSDRIWEAVRKFDPQGEYDVIINLQGDVPTLEPRLLKELLGPLENPKVDISTLITEIKDPSEITNPSVVKALVTESGSVVNVPSFSRTAGPKAPHYHHIGVYGYRRAALEKFVSLPPSSREKQEKLEQLRALDAGMRIDAAVVGTVPLGVDTPEDLEKARKLLGA